MFNINKIKNLDLVLSVTVLILVVIGCMNVFATTYYPTKEPSGEFYNQILFYFLGIICSLIVSVFDYKKLRNKYIQLGIFLITIILLLLVLAIGTTRYGATRWIAIGSFLFQPSELAKISVILLFAYLLSLSSGISIAKDRINLSQKIKFLYINKLNIVVLSKSLITSISKLIFRKNLLIFLIWFSFAFLIMQQHSLGNTMLLTGISAIIVFYAKEFSWQTISYILSAAASILISFGIFKLNINPEQSVEVLGLKVHPPTVILLLIIIIISTNIFRASYIKALTIFVAFTLTSIFMSFSYNNILEPYQRKRIDSFLQVGGGDLDQTSNWNREQSLIACGSGKAFGKGFTQGTQSNYKFLPFSFTDFAYCGYVEQFGLIGAVVLVGVYCALLYRIIKIAERTRDKFGSYILVGVFGLLLLNMLQHIGMNIGLLPITGVPLPFISYGGTSVIIAFVSVGFAQSVSNFSEQRKLVLKPKLKVKKRGNSRYR